MTAMTDPDSLPVRAAGLRRGKLGFPVTIRFAEPQRDRLAAFARQHGVSMADAVRYAVDSLLRGSSPTVTARSTDRTPKKVQSERSVKPRFRKT